MDEPGRGQTLFNNLVEGVRQEHKWPSRAEPGGKSQHKAMRSQEVNYLFGDREKLHGGDRPQRLHQNSRGETGTQNSESIVLCRISFHPMRP